MSLVALPLASCANSGLGRSLQDSLAADPRLTQTTPTATPSPAPSPPVQAELPTDFPSEIPQYPNATLQEVVTAEAAAPNAEITTIWQTGDSSDRVAAFYREQLQTDGWELQAAPLTSEQGTLVAQRNTPKPLTVTITIPPAPTPSPTATPSPAPTQTAAGTQFTIQYASGVAIGQSPSPPPPASEVFLGAEGTSEGSTPPATAPVATLPPNNYTDLNKAPQELQRYLSDLAQLGVLNLSPAGQAKTTSTTFSPNKPVSRREYARWLFEANNRLFSDRPAQQIRSASGVAQPAFRDVPPADPDFAAIQGLAEAGIIPSSLSGNPTAVNFRPDAQLSRETMLLWKVPMDTRQPLPTATLDAIKQTWGFQDAARIDPIAQRAVLADFQNADLSNIRRVFGFTTLFQPKRAVTRAEAAATLWYFGYQGDGASAQEALKTQ